MYIDTNGRTRPEAAAYISSIIATRSAAVKVKRPQPLGEDDRAETTPKELLQDEIHNDLSYKEGECDIVGKNAARAGCSIHDGRDVANSEDARSGDNFHSARHDARPDPVPNNNTVWTDARPDPVPNNNKNKGAGRYEQEEAHARKDMRGYLSLKTGERTWRRRSATYLTSWPYPQVLTLKHVTGLEQGPEVETGPY